MDIDICIPYVGVGIIYLEKQISNLIELSSGKNTLYFKVSFHTDEDLKILKNSKIFKEIYETIQVEKSEIYTFYNNSISHSNAINKLYSICSSKFCIFMDYDMFFLQRHWDEQIINNLEEKKIDLFGIPYKSVYISLKKIIGKKIFSRHYQNYPNLSFLCFKLENAKKYFPSKLTDFSDIAKAKDFSPFVVINSYELKRIYQMNIGEVLWLDTGYEIPKIIHKNNLTYQSLSFSDKDLINPNLEQTLESPEFLTYNENNFLAHYKKGTNKAKNNIELFEKFYFNIQKLIN